MVRGRGLSETSPRHVCDRCDRLRRPGLRLPGLGPCEYSRAGGRAVSGRGPRRTLGHRRGIRLSNRLCGAVSSHGRGTDPPRKALSAAVRERARVDECDAVASHRRGVSRSAGIAGRGQPHRGPGARVDGRGAGWGPIRDLPTRRRRGRRTGSAVPGRREDPGRAFTRAEVDHGIDTTRVVHSQELESITGLTRYDLARQFRIMLGTSPYRYLLMRRLEFARERIHRDRPLVEVAFDAGFADPAHFTRAFRSAFGLTAAPYRALTPS